ncbi:MAG TPA: hypothetical protein VFC23_02235 [Thermoanaerobaculia bacterium]|nr:hypothetical protein [Thermoanaerobaculia bacterium]
MSSPGDHERAAAVYRRFRRAGRNALGRHLSHHWQIENASLIAGIGLFLGLLFLEPALWAGGLFLVDASIPGWLAVAALGFLPLNGWALDRFLSWMTARERCLPLWLRGLRWLAACVPLLGLYLVPVWRRFLAAGAGRVSIGNRRGSRLNLSDPAAGFPPGLRNAWFFTSGAFALLLSSGFLPIVLWAAWLAHTPRLGSARVKVILAVSVVLHLLAFAALAHHFGSTRAALSVRERRRIAWARASSLLWLLPAPASIAALILWALPKPNREPLIWTAYARRTDAARRTLQRSALAGQEPTVPWFQPWRRSEGAASPWLGTQTEVEVTGYYRVKTFLLAIESGALLWLSSKLPINRGLRIAFLGALCLAALGLAVQCVGFGMRLLRIDSAVEWLDRHPYGRYLLLTQAAFLAGTEAASLWLAGRAVEVGAFIALGAVLWVMPLLFLLIIPLFHVPDRRDLLLWIGLLLALAMLGLFVILEGDLSGLSSKALAAIAAASAVLGLSLSCARLAWLIRPFSWRHLLDLRLAPGLRGHLLLVVATAAVPLGGLAIPYWIYVRHRVLPRHAHLVR